MLDLPSPVGMFNDAVLGKIERDEIKQFVSVLWSNYITGLWRQGCVLSSKWWGNEGEVLKDMAVATFKTIEPMLAKGYAITVPADMLADVNRFANFQTERKLK